MDQVLHVAHYLFDYVFLQHKDGKPGDIEAKPSKDEEEQENVELPPEEDDPEVLKLLLEQEREALVEQVSYFSHCNFLISVPN